MSGYSFRVKKTERRVKVAFSDGAQEYDGALSQGFDCADGTLRAILHALSAEPQKAYAFALSGAAKEQFCRLAEAYAQYHLGRGFDSLQFYKSIAL